MHRFSKWMLLVLAATPPGNALCANEAAPGLRPEAVRPAMLVWDIGTNRPSGAVRYLETVTRATDGNRQLWRITHYPHDIVTARALEFDLYDVDAATLTPVRSVMRNATLDLTISFDGSHVSVSHKEDTAESVHELAAAGILRPEGPGLTVFVASLPLRVGYALAYDALDRWHGPGETRIKRMRLEVLERRHLSTQMGTQDTFKLQIEPEDGSFRVVEDVRATAPHYPLRVEYTRGRFTLSSEVVAIGIAEQ